MSDLDWLYARQRFGVHPGLGRVRDLLARLGDPQRGFPDGAGGRNQRQGQHGGDAGGHAGRRRAERTALFTSPHLTRFAERFVVGGQEVPPETVARRLGRVRPQAEALGATFFEIVVALALRAVCRSRVPRWR